MIREGSYLGVNSPCLGCEHTPGCHGKCEKFSDYKKRLEEAKKKVRVEQLLDSMDARRCERWVDRERRTTKK